MKNQKIKWESLRARYVTFSSSHFFLHNLLSNCIKLNTKRSTNHTILRREINNGCLDQLNGVKIGGEFRAKVSLFGKAPHRVHVTQKGLNSAWDIKEKDLLLQCPAGFDGIVEEIPGASTQKLLELEADGINGHLYMWRGPRSS